MPGPPKKTSPIEPIMLWGFCFSTQAKQKFNTPWGAAWLTNQYTDERHEMWQHIDRDDILKKREIKYGNNIAVLFGALLECRSFWGRDGFWHAIARGFNTNATILRCTVEILTDARRIQRGKPAKEISETARAADRWISFLDNEALRQKPHRAGEAGAEATLNRVADAYFKKQEKSWVNAAWVPINPNREFREAQHTRPSTPIKSEPNDARVPQPRSAQMRKRSPSPSAFDSRSPKVRRMSHISGSGDIIPPTGPRGHPSRDHFDFAIYKDAEYPSRDIRDWDKNWDKDRGRDLLPPLAGRREDDAELRLNPSRYANGEGDYHRDDLHHNLKARIVSLEKELAQTKNKLATQPPPPPTTGTATAASATSGGSEPITNGNSSTSNQLDKQMNSVTDAVSTMMESMHDIVDGLTRLQDEVSTLSSSKDESCQTHPVPEQVMNDSKLEPTLTIISDTLKSLQSELSELKEQQKQAQPPTPPQIPSSDLSELKSILKQQSEQISALTQTVTRLQRQSPSMAAGSGSGSEAGRQTPQTLQQAITNAERDLWHHYSVVSDFYHKLDINTTSRASTERTAEFLAVLQHSFETAKGMSGSPLP